MLVDLVQRSNEEADVPQRQRRARDPLLSRDRAGRGDPLRAAGGGHPVGGDVAGAPQAVPQELDLGRDVQARELGGAVAQATDQPVEVLLERGGLRVEDPGGNRPHRGAQGFLIGDHGRVIALWEHGGHAGRMRSRPRSAGSRQRFAAQGAPPANDQRPR